MQLSKCKHSRYDKHRFLNEKSIDCSLWFIEEPLDSCPKHQHHQPESDQHNNQSIAAVQIQDNKASSDNCGNYEVRKTPEDVRSGM